MKNINVQVGDLIQITSNYMSEDYYDIGDIGKVIAIYSDYLQVKFENPKLYDGVWYVDLKEFKKLETKFNIGDKVVLKYDIPWRNGENYRTVKSFEKVGDIRGYILNGVSTTIWFDGELEKYDESKKYMAMPLTKTLNIIQNGQIYKNINPYGHIQKISKINGDISFLINPSSSRNIFDVTNRDKFKLI